MLLLGLPYLVLLVFYTVKKLILKNEDRRVSDER